MAIACRTRTRGFNKQATFAAFVSLQMSNSLILTFDRDCPSYSHHSHISTLSVALRLQAAMLTVLQIHLGDAGEGDILVFLPGQEEIETLTAMLRSKLELLETFVTKHRREFGEGVEFSVRLGDEVYRHRKMQRLLVCPLYAALPFDQQQQVLLPAPPQYSRKVRSMCVFPTLLPY